MVSVPRCRRLVERKRACAETASDDHRVPGVETAPNACRSGRRQGAEAEVSAEVLVLMRRPRQERAGRSTGGQRQLQVAARRDVGAVAARPGYPNLGHADEEKSRLADPCAAPTCGVAPVRARARDHLRIAVRHVGTCHRCLHLEVPFISLLDGGRRKGSTSPEPRRARPIVGRSP